MFAAVRSLDNNERERGGLVFGTLGTCLDLRLRSRVGCSLPSLSVQFRTANVRHPFFFRYSRMAVWLRIGSVPLGATI